VKGRTAARLSPLNASGEREREKERERERERESEREKKREREEGEGGQRAAGQSYFAFSPNEIGNWAVAAAAASDLTGERSFNVVFS
jgi:hypothetical protein